MRKQVTVKQLQGALDYLNKIVGASAKPWRAIHPGMEIVANVGNYHLEQSYGMFGVNRMSNESGGIVRVIDLGTKRECLDQIFTLRRGIEIGMEMSKGGN